MDDLWSILVPLIVASALLPLQIAVTILFLQSAAGRLGAFAWIAGMAVIRLIQGGVLGTILAVGTANTGSVGRPGPIESAILLVVAVVFLVMGLRKFLREPDDDAPPPRWMAIVATMSPLQAFAGGATVVAVSPKLWAFTIGAIGAIAEAGLSQGTAVAAYLVFTVGALGIHLGILISSILAPVRAGRILTALSEGLARYDRPIMIGLSLVFGTWFLGKALTGFGII